MCTIDRILVLDTETASLENGVVEIAWYEIDEAFNILDRQRSLINPERPIDPRAAGVHGIVDEDVKDAPTLSQFMAGRFANESVLLIGHNIKFDIRFVGTHFKEVDALCTLMLARRAWPQAPDHKLQTLMHYLKLTRAGNHNAMDDVHTAYELAILLSKELCMDMQQLYDLSHQPIFIEKMPFGKHKDMPLRDLPRPYVRWLLEKADNLDENLRWSLQQI